MVINVVSDIIRVATVKMDADVFGEKPRYCEK
jgi:hypothetical protein